MFIQQKTLELWAPIYDAVEIKVYHRYFIVKMAFIFVHMKELSEKHYIVMDVPVHGEQIELSSIFLFMRYD